MKWINSLQATSAAGGMIFGISLIELNALLGIILTITSFILLVVPKIINLVKKIKDAKADGVITEEETKDIVNSSLDIVKDVKDTAEDIKDKVNK